MNKMHFAWVAFFASMGHMACTKKSPNSPKSPPIIVEPVPDSIDLIGKRIAGTYSWVGTRHDRIPIDSYDTTFNISYSSEIVDIGNHKIVLKNLYPLYLHFSTEDTLTYVGATASTNSLTYEVHQQLGITESMSDEVTFYTLSGKITCQHFEASRYVSSTLDAHTP